MGTQILLVPGFWLGAWAWDQVAEPLRQLGYAVNALTLPGLESDAPNRSLVTLDDQAVAIGAALDRVAARRVLVVHSGAALPGTMILDRFPELIDHVVFVDTAPVRDGFAMNAEATADLTLADAWEEEFSAGSMRDLTDSQLAEFRERAVPQPVLTVSQSVRLTDPRRLATPGTLIATAYSAADYQTYAKQGMPFLAGLLDHTAIRYIDLPTGHWPMWSRPAELATIIAEAADDVGWGNAPLS